MKVIFVDLVTDEKKEYNNIDKLIHENTFLRIDGKRVHVRNVELVVCDESFYVVRYYSNLVEKLYQAEMDKKLKDGCIIDKEIEQKCFNDALNAVQANLYE